MNSNVLLAAFPQSSNLTAPWVCVAICLVVLLGLLAALIVFRNVGVLFSVFRRNFVSYFANPTAICSSTCS